METLTERKDSVKSVPIQIDTINLPERVKPLKLAIVGTFTPRKCGIASFTTDLCQHLKVSGQYPPHIEVVAINDGLLTYKYPAFVTSQIHYTCLQDYEETAAYINENGFDAIILQHEFGLFGGRFGSFILHFIKSLTVPLFTVLHSVLQSPNEEQYRITRELYKYSQRFIVINPIACNLLKNSYDLNTDRVKMIPHGVPDVFKTNPDALLKSLNLSARKILLTFGLIGPGKGIEDMIDALPAIIKEHPDVCYIVLGATHPHIQMHDGESYRESLKSRAAKHNLNGHVLFYDHFVSTEDICSFLRIADIMVTPHLCQEQISSGTLAYGMSAGLPIVSTPFWYAKEMLKDGAGIIFPFRDKHRLSESVIMLLSDETRRHAIGNIARKRAREMLWPNIADQYLCTINTVLKSNTKPLPKPSNTVVSSQKMLRDIPPICLDHIRLLTDDKSIIQHAKFGRPSLEYGYCIDDNARALIAISILYRLFRDPSVLPLFKTYLSFQEKAFNKHKQRFRNVMNSEGRWLDDEGSEDTQGRSLWALGTMVENALDFTTYNRAKTLLLQALPSAETFVHLRPKAFALIGLRCYMRIHPEEAGVRRIAEHLGRSLYAIVQKRASDEWLWPEGKVTYANAKIPHAILCASDILNDITMREDGLKLLKWLLSIQTGSGGYLSVVGNRGWLTQQGHRAQYDQQALEAMTLEHACIEAFRLTGDFYWLEEAWRCLRWYLGKNDLGLPMFDYLTGAGYDGFSDVERSENKGAEATLSWLLAQVYMYDVLSHEALEEK